MIQPTLIRTCRALWSVLFALSCFIPASTVAVAQQATAVEAAELARRVDLVGHEVVVDDRVAFYVSRTGTEDDEIRLKRSQVPFFVPSRLRPENAARMSAVVVRGMLEREGTRVVCRVTELRPVPGDLERLKQGLASLTPQDYLKRQAWARWAEQRGKEFNDNTLVQKGRALEAEALQIQGDSKRVAVDAPREWLALARDARQRRVPEPEPSALAHRAFRALLQETSDPVQLRALAGQIESFFPAVESDRRLGEVNLGRHEAAYLADAAAGYRSAPESIRKALDRRLWADVMTQVFDREPVPDLAAAVAASEKVASLLPERPKLPKIILERAVSADKEHLGELRLDQMKALAQLIREKLEQPQESSQVISDWLKVRRERLSRTDAEGRMLLAVQFEDLASDRASAIELLQESWKIDPSSRDLEQAFRTRGFHKEKNAWVESTKLAGSERDPAPTARGSAGATQGLRGLTPDEVRTRLGRKADRISKIGTRGQLIEQWIFLDTRQVRFVNLLHAPGELKPRVIADYVLPRTGPKDEFDSAR